MSINFSIDLAVHHGFAQLVPERGPDWSLSNVVSLQTASIKLGSKR